MSRILLLNYEFPPVGGGGGVAAKTIAKGFVEHGFEVDYVTSHHHDLARTEQVEGITVHRVPVRRREMSTASFFSMIAYPASGFLKCLQLCRQHEYDFINTHFAIPSGPLGVAVSHLFDLPHVLSIHGGDIYDPTKQLSPHNKWYLQKVVTWVINSADFVVAQSSDTRKNARRYYKIRDDRDIDVIPLPYEPYSFESAEREELGLESEVTYLVSVGRLVERKGFHYLIEAFTSLEEGIEAIIIGAGPKRNELEALAETHGVEDRVHFTGFVDDERKFQYLDCADIFVLSSVHEGFGIVLQEAMQVGLPIVAADNGGQVDLIEDGIHGHLVTPEDADALASGIRDVIDHDFSTYEDDGEDYLQQFSPASISQSYLNLLQ